MNPTSPEKPSASAPMNPILVAEASNILILLFTRVCPRTYPMTATTNYSEGSIGNSLPEADRVGQRGDFELALLRQVVYLDVGVQRER